MSRKQRRQTQGNAGNEARELHVPRPADDVPPRRRRWMLAAAVALIVVALTIGGVVAARAGHGTLEAASVSRAAASSGGSGGALAAFQTTRATGGSVFTADDVTGPAVIHVFASWCEVCQGEAASFAQLQREHPKLNYYLLDVQDTTADARSFISKYGWSKTSVLLSDPQRSAEAQLGLIGQPNTLFVDKNGKVVQTLQGGVGTGALLDAAAKIA
jgi:cytochrome c biogenesis protein CcmG/thiol:disulfide interchange protein DsbE